MRSLGARLRLFPLFGLLVVAPSQEALGHAIDLFRQSTQERPGADSGTGGENDVQTLETGKPHRRRLAGGQRHTYRISPAADQFLKVVIEQDGVDVAARLLGPDGKQIMGFDSESRLRGAETVEQVAEAEGDYRLVLQPKQKAAPAGAYEIRIEELRAATESDRALHEARKLYKKVNDLRVAGKYEEALPYIERALEIRERILGPDHPDVSQAINSLAALHYYKGEYSKAEPLYQRALAIWEKSLGPEHLNVAHTLNNLATLYSALGDYVKAEPLYQRALAIKEKALGPDHPDVAMSLNNLANLYGALGDHAKAEPLQRRALAIKEKALGPDHPDVAMSLNNLANLYGALGDYAKAEPLQRRALAIREKALGPYHPEVALSLLNLATLYSDQSDYAKAEPFYRRALAIREKSLGPQNPLTARSLDNLAILYGAMRDYAKAEPLFQRALAIQEKSLDPDHPDVIHSLDGLARLHMAKNEIAQAIAYQSRAAAVVEHNLKLNLAIGSERQKLAYLATISKQTDQTISLHLLYARQDPAAGALAATLILQRKGRALDAASESLNALRSRFNEEDRAELDKLTGARSQIARLVLDGPQRMNAERHRAQVKTLEEQAEKFEAEISHRSDEFRAQSLPVTLEAVRAAIPDDAALIEFASYRPFNAKAAKYDDAFSRPHYVAYILRRQGEIEWKELGDAKAIDDAVAALRKALRDPKRKDVKNLARVADLKVFQPLRPMLGNLTRLLISPEGSLNLIPFAALVDERGRYLVERYSISYLSSGRDLLRLQVARKSKSGPLVIADPDFGGRRQVEATRLLKQTKGPPEKQGRDDSPATTFSKFYFPALPYTAEEGKAIGALLPGATLLTKRRANKEALRQSQSPNILHIATHGFFLDNLNLTSTGGRSPRKSSQDESRRLKQVEKDGSRIENPLLRAGLAMAGANEQKEGGNGILTALEMTGLNLWGTKLMTLSACDTGVGEVRNGDGVHGLRRALALAGAETQVMSLWAVSDRWTRELMVAYYRRLRQGQGRAAALRQAQLEMFKVMKRRHPYFWASFILSGEWANLEGEREK
jgi:CHAT domain-containing protein/Tfp pilus assembly protein PilF